MSPLHQVTKVAKLAFPRSPRVPISVLCLPRTVTLLYSMPLRLRLPLTFIFHLPIPRSFLPPSYFASTPQLVRTLSSPNTRISYLSAEWFSLLIYSSLASLQGNICLLPPFLPSHSLHISYNFKASTINALCFRHNLPLKTLSSIPVDKTTQE